MATTTTKTETLVGKRIRRREDPRLITGTATYVDDIQISRKPWSCPASPQSSPARTQRMSHRCPVAHRFPGCASRIIICWRWIACTWWVIRSPSW
jgi:hypothetical protein